LSKTGQVSPKAFASAADVAAYARQAIFGPKAFESGAKVREAPRTGTLKVNTGASLGFSQSLLALGPDLYWPLDAVYGATDQSGNGRNGTADGGIVLGGYSASPPPIAGVTSCTDFDGSNDRILGPAGYHFANYAQMTYLFWLNMDAWPPASGVGHGLVGDSFQGYRYELRDFPSYELRHSAGHDHNWTPVALASGTWVFVACVVDLTNDVVETYENGVSIGQIACAPDGVPYVGGDMRLGWTGFWLDAKMGHFAIMPQALSAAQIAGLYAASGSPSKGALSGPDVFQATETGLIAPKAFESGVRNVSLSKTGSLQPKAFISGADVFTATETGSITPKASQSGGGDQDFNETGTTQSKVTLSGVAQVVRTYAKTGTISPKASMSGADVFEATETGSISPKAAASAGDVFEDTEAGTLQPKAFLSGADALTTSETGQVQSGPRLSGAKASTFSETGSVQPKAFLSGSDQSTFARSGQISPKAALSGQSSTVAGTTYTKTGTISPKAAMSGADAYTATKTGTISLKALQSGTGTWEASRTGQVSARVSQSGAKASAIARTGTLSAKVALSGFYSHTWTKAGSLEIKPQASATDIAEFDRAGSIAVVSVLTGTATVGASIVQQIHVFTWHEEATSLWLDEDARILEVRHEVIEAEELDQGAFSLELRHEVETQEIDQE